MSGTVRQPLHSPQLPPHDPVSARDVTVSPDQVRTELDAVCQSRIFRRSEKLQQFLRYVCESTLAGDSSQIKEYVIAQDVFERGSDYSPHEDSIVRRQAYALRQKLEKYYATERKEDSVRIEIPVGSYVPVFTRRGHQSTEMSAPVSALAASAARRWPKPLPVVALAIGGLVLFGFGWQLGRSRSRGAAREAAADPAVREVWGPWLDDGSNILIGFTDLNTVLVRRYNEPAPPDSNLQQSSPTGSEEQQFRRAFALPPGGYIYLMPSTAHTRFGEAVSAVQLAELFSSSGIRPQITKSHFLNWDVARKNNLILLGAPEQNSWVELLLRQFPLRFADIKPGVAPHIINTAPARNEPAQFLFQTPGRGYDKSYALISMSTSVDGQHRLALLTGINSQSTQIATEFMTDPGHLHDLLQRLRSAAPDHKGPWQFQAVLENEAHDNVPTRASVVLTHVF